MEEKVLRFIELLRRNGCRVSTLETLDCFRGIGIAGIADRNVFKNTLRSTLVKSAAEAAVFNELFGVYFLNEWRAIAEIHASFHSATEDEPPPQTLLAMLDDPPDALTRALIENDAPALQRILEEAGCLTGTDSIIYIFQDNLYTHRMLTHMNWQRAAAQIDGVRKSLDAAGLTPQQRAAADNFLQELARRLPETVKEHVQRMRKRNQADAHRRPNLESLMDKSFFNLTEDEKRWMKEAVKKLAEKMKTVVTVRARACRKGRLNVRKTLRRNIRHGGVPFHVAFDWKRKKKQQIVVLCDVSESVRYASNLMLHFVYCLQELFARVRSFVFVSELGEVTNLFNRKDTDAAFAGVMNNSVIDVSDYTNYGLSFLRFHDRFSHIVNKRTTVIILGDARTNYADPRPWILKNIHRKAHSVVWLNPESRYSWDQDDSVMGAYQPYCDEVFEIKNTRQLLHAVSHITRVSRYMPG